VNGRSRSGRLAAIIAAGGLTLLLAPAAWAEATIVVNNLDGAGEGFNDPTPFTPVGGNPATTLGSARLVAFSFAATTWGRKLNSAVQIRVDATIDALACSQTSAVLGAAGTITVHRDFSGALLASTWYPQALANALAGTDLDPASSDITALFNGTLDAGTCLGGTRWYYGLDGAPPPGDVDFVTVVLHELGHGLGFQTFVALGTGAKFLGRDDVYARKLEHHGAIPADYPSMTNDQRVTASTSDPDLHWLGGLVNAAGSSSLSGGVASGHVRMYGPAPQQPGASVSHFSVDLVPDQLMEPFYTGPDHDLGLTLKLLEDLGWTAAPPVTAAAVPAASPWTLGLLAVGLVVAAVGAWGRARADRAGSANLRCSRCSDPGGGAGPGPGSGPPATRPAPAA